MASRHGFVTAFRESALVYPIVLTGHLTGMGLFGGMIAITDMRLLGWAMRGSSITDVVEQLRIWKRIGFVLVVGCGSMLLSAKAELYYHNPFYWTKMTLLLLVGVHALVFRRSVYGNTVELDRAPTIPARAKVAACISLFLWLGLVARAAPSLIGTFRRTLRRFTTHIAQLPAREVTHSRACFGRTQRQTCIAMTTVAPRSKPQQNVSHGHHDEIGRTGGVQNQHQERADPKAHLSQNERDQRSRGAPQGCGPRKFCRTTDEPIKARNATPIATAMCGMTLVMS